MPAISAQRVSRAFCASPATREGRAPISSLRATSMICRDTAGGGNGQVNGTYNSAIATDESRLWWNHLRRGGYADGRRRAQHRHGALHTGGPNPDIGGASGMAVATSYAETGANVYTLCRSM